MLSPPSAGISHPVALIWRELCSCWAVNVKQPRETTAMGPCPVLLQTQHSAPKRGFPGLFCTPAVLITVITVRLSNCCCCVI